MLSRSCFARRNISSRRNIQRQKQKFEMKDIEKSHSVSMATKEDLLKMNKQNINEPDALVDLAITTNRFHNPDYYLKEKVSDEYKKAMKTFYDSAYQTNQSLGNSLEAQRILKRIHNTNELLETPKDEPLTVAVTGAAGQIAYSLLFRIASGAMFGRHTPIKLRLLDIPQAQNALKGVIMELKDCAFPLLLDISATDNAEVAFEDVDYALLVGAKPRSKGMERGDLLRENAKIFAVQGKALDLVGKGSGTRVAVVGNPANTNALITSRNAPSIPAKNFAAMTRLDENRGLGQLASKLNTAVSDIERFVIWGNHSATQFPDIYHATVNGKLVSDLVDEKWYKETFIPTVQQRGAKIIEARGLSSAASAANALVDNVRDWHLGTSGRWTSVAVSSKGEYGVEEGIFYSYPIVYQGGEYEIVKDLPITNFAAEKMEATHQELLQERDAVAELLP